MERRVLLAMLAEAATGADVVDDADFPDPDDPVALEIITDPYLVEPADPNRDPDAPIGWDTKLRPSPVGRDLLFVGKVLEHWLRECPDGPVELGAEAGPALSSLLGGWSSTVIHALAPQPPTIGEITETIGILDRNIVEERVDETASAGLATVLNENGEERLAPTEWLRAAIAPLAAGARQELLHPLEDTAPIAALDVQTAFLFTLPMVALQPKLSGSCTLAVDLEDGVPGSPAGVTVRIEPGPTRLLRDIPRRERGRLGRRPGRRLARCRDRGQHPRGPLGRRLAPHRRTAQGSAQEAVRRVLGVGASRGDLDLFPNKT